MWKRARSLYRDATRRASASSNPWLRHGMGVAHAVVALVNKSLRDRLGMRAAMLAFWTALSVVPVLLLAFALTGPLGLTDQTRDVVKEFLYETVLSSSVDEIGGVLDTLLMGTNLRTIGVAGVVGLLLAGAQLFFTVEATYNELYGARIRRGMIYRFLVYYAAITLGPLMLGWGLISTSGLGNPGLVTLLLSGGLMSLVLVVSIWLLPDTEVSWRAAIVGGLFSSLLFEGAKGGFSLYIDLFGSKSGLAIAFGSLAFIPFALLWIEVVWIIVLLGVEVAYVLQHRSWQLVARQALDLDKDTPLRWPDGTFALTLFALLVERFERAEGPADPNVLAARMGVEPTAVLNALSVLEDVGLVLETSGGGFAPAQPAEHIHGADVLQRWRAAAGLGGESVDPVVQRITARLKAAEARLDLPLSALLARPENEGG